MNFQAEQTCAECHMLLPPTVYVQAGLRRLHVTCYKELVVQPQINNALNDQAEKFREEMEVLRKANIANDAILKAKVRAECMEELRRAAVRGGSDGVDKFINKVEQEATGKPDSLLQKLRVAGDVPTAPAIEEVKNKEMWEKAAHEIAQLAKAHFGPLVPSFYAVAKFIYEKMSQRKMFVQWIEVEPEAAPSEEDKKRAAEFMAQLNALKEKK